ncbi:MAG TPA: HEAT repeat domain-containing protein [Terriglobales bacterium]|nr:HEAT repeat domain-containing protein [Terriglobales bacterium]
MSRFLFVCCMLTTFAHGQVEGKFTLSKLQFAAGEPIWLTLEMTNTGTETLYFDAGSPYSFCGGYRLEVNQGNPIRHPSCVGGVAGSCLSGSHTFRGGERLTEKLLLNYDHDLSQPGWYHVSATRYLSTATTDDLRAMVNGRQTKFTDEFDIEITARDDATLKAQLAPYVEQLKSPNEEVVREAARVLSSSAPAFLESTMLAMLDRPATRQFAITGLKNINSVAAREALAEIARSGISKYSYEADMATEALSEMGDQEYFPLLKQIAESKPPNQSGEAVRYAATLGGDDAIPWLASKLRDSNPIARGAVVWALAATGSRRAVPILIDLLLSNDEHLPETAEIALVQLTHRSVLPNKYTSGEPRVAHRSWVRWWTSHSDAPVYGPKSCGEIQPLS